MVKKFLYSILFCSILFIELPCNAVYFGNLRAESFSLFQVLQTSKMLITQTDNSNENLELLQLINKELTLFKEIISEFNKGNSLYTRSRFISLCNHFKRYDYPEPRHIRLFAEKLKRFDRFIQGYVADCNDTLPEEEKILCAKIHEFVQILNDNFLRYEYFEIDIFDRIVDWSVYRPLECAKAHPLITTAVILTILAGLSWYGYKYIKKIKEEAAAARVTVARKPAGVAPSPDANNPEIPEDIWGDIPKEAVVTRQSTERQQGDAMCGKYAFMNVEAAYAAIGTHQNFADVDWKTVVAEDAKTQKTDEWAGVLSQKTDTEMPTIIANILYQIDQQKTEIDSIIQSRDTAKKELKALPAETVWEMIFGCNNPELERRRSEISNKITDLSKLITKEQQYSTQNIMQTAAHLADCKMRLENAKKGNKRALLNMMESREMAWILEYEKSRGRWQNVYLIQDKTLLNSLHVDSVSVQDQVTKVKNYIENELPGVLCQNIKAGQDVVVPENGFEGAVWKHCVRPIFEPLIREKLGITDEDLKNALRDKASEIEILSRTAKSERTRTSAANLHADITASLVKENAWKEHTHLIFSDVIAIKCVGMEATDLAEILKPEDLKGQLMQKAKQLKIFNADNSCKLDAISSAILLGTAGDNGGNFNGLLSARNGLWASGEPIHFVVNLGSRVSGGVVSGSEKGCLHWVQYTAYKDGNDIKLSFADSLGGKPDPEITCDLYNFLKIN